MEISIVNVNRESKWAVITRRNVPGYPAFRLDSFETREEALEYYKAIVVETPLVSLNGESPNPRRTIEEYKKWLVDNGLADDYL
jgi:viroplasmin and RNaseH domain-containing protein